ncbi:MAG: hypothetical protein R3E95_08480 [Thiolinea sp.]
MSSAVGACGAVRYEVNGPLRPPPVIVGSAGVSSGHFVAATATRKQYVHWINQDGRAGIATGTGIGRDSASSVAAACFLT